MESDASWISQLLALVNFPHPSNPNPPPPELPPLILVPPSTAPPQARFFPPPVPPPPPPSIWAQNLFPQNVSQQVPLSPPETEDLDQLWQKVMYRLTSKSARALMEQRVKLVLIEGSRAKISSPPELRRMVEDRIDQVEEAFRQVMGYSVNIFVETISKP